MRAQRILAAAGGAALCAALFAAPADADPAVTASGAATCHGHRVTIADVGPGHRIVGTNGRDVIRVPAGRHRVTVIARGGNDIICGSGRGDHIRGGAGHDIVLAGKGADRVDAGAGRDRIYGDSGRDRLRGGPGRDGIFGGAGDNDMALGPADYGNEDRYSLVIAFTPQDLTSLLDSGERVVISATAQVQGMPPAPTIWQSFEPELLTTTFTWDPADAAVFVTDSPPEPGVTIFPDQSLPIDPGSWASVDPSGLLGMLQFGQPLQGYEFGFLSQIPNQVTAGLSMASAVDGQGNPPAPVTAFSLFGETATVVEVTATLQVGVTAQYLVPGQVALPGQVPMTTVPFGNSDTVSVSLDQQTGRFQAVS